MTDVQLSAEEKSLLGSLACASIESALAGESSPPRRHHACHRHCACIWELLSP